MSFGIYIVGYIVYIVVMVNIGNLLTAPTQWIVVGVLCLTGMAIVHGVTATRIIPQARWAPRSRADILRKR